MCFQLYRIRSQYEISRRHLRLNKRVRLLVEGTGYLLGVHIVESAVRAEVVALTISERVFLNLLALVIRISVILVSRNQATFGIPLPGEQRL